VLCGCEPGASDSSAVREAEAIRRTIAAEQTREAEALDPLLARRLRNSLVERLRRERLLDSEPAAARKRLPAFAAVAALLLVFVLAYWYMPGYAPPTPGMSDDFPVHLVTRSGSEVQTVSVDSPDRAAAELLGEVESLGLPWRLSKVGDDWFLEIFVGSEPTREVERWIDKGGYRASSLGWIHLLIGQATRKPGE